MHRTGRKLRLGQMAISAVASERDVPYATLSLTLARLKLNYSFHAVTVLESSISDRYEFLDTLAYLEMTSKTVHFRIPEFFRGQ
jgi:hypothetical protein